MEYKITIYSNITNTGAYIETKTFDTYYEVQDFILEQVMGMTEDEEELFMSNVRIEKLGEGGEY